MRWKSLLVILLAGTTLSACVTLTPGRFDTAFRVSPEGAAGYTVVLWSPPGRQGVQPWLDLHYDSRAGNGIAGVGWAMSAGSRIERCRLNLEIDGFVEPLTFTDRDAFCLDGERLVLTQGTHARAGGEYRTRHQTFAKIVVVDADELGPTAFRIYRRDGRIATYGPEPESRIEGSREGYAPLAPSSSEIVATQTPVRYAWLLDHEEDRSGNGMRFSYDSAPEAESKGTERRLTQIAYTYGPTIAGSREPIFLDEQRFIRFRYEAREDEDSQFVAGLKLGHTSRLSVIEVVAPNPDSPQTIRSYRLSYVLGSSGRSLLKRIQECISRTCRPAHTFAYQLSEDGFDEVDTDSLGQPINDVRTTAGGRSGAPGRVHIVDLNGDGRDDILYASPDGKYSYRLSVLDATGHVTLGPAVPIGAEMSMRPERPQPLDFNADGNTDLVLFDDRALIPGTAQGAVYRLRLANAATSGGSGSVLSAPSVLPGEYVHVSDLDGDRLPDAFVSSPVDRPDPSGFRAWSTRRNLGGGQLSAPATINSLVPPDHLRFLDVDGDGATEILAPWNPTLGQWWIAVQLLRGPSHTEQKYWPMALRFDESHVFIDINGDGLLDDLTPSTAASDTKVAINTGNGFRPAQPHPLLVYNAPQNTLDPLPTAFRVFDYNGDGRQDLIIRPQTFAQADPILVSLSTGAGFATPFPTQITSSPVDKEDAEVFEVLDVNGDGLDDLIMQNGGALRLYVRRGGKPDLLIRATDGLGASLEIQYRPITDAAVYTAGPSSCAYPQRCQPGKMWVVTVSARDTGLGIGKYHYSYHYANGRSDARTGELLGFETFTRTDLEFGEERALSFDLSARPSAGIFGLKGRPISVRTRVSLDDSWRHSNPEGPAAPWIHVIQRDVDYEFKQDAVDESYFAYPAHMTDEEFIENGSSHYQVRRSSATFISDNFGNLLDETRTWDDGHKELTRTTYDNRIGDWLVGLPTLRVQTSEVPGGIRRSRRTAFTHDARGLLAQEIIEPGERSSSGVWQPLPPQPDGVQTLYRSLVRDAAGQIRELMLHSAPTPGADARRTRVEFDPIEDLFPVRIENAVGQATTLEHHRGMGLMHRTVDANGLITLIDYDEFGRPIHEAKTGMASRTRQYELLPNNVRGYLERETLSTGGITEVVHDVLGRGIETRTTSRPDGKRVLQRVEYDERDRPSRVSQPFFDSETPQAALIAYDALDRLRSVTTAGGTSTTITYGDSIARSPPTTSQLREVRVNAAGGRWRAVIADEIANPIEVTEHLAERDFTTSYRYGPFKTLELISGPVPGKLSIETDRLGRTLQTVALDVGKRDLQYNAFGEVTAEISPRGTRSFAYDALGRLTNSTGPDGTTIFTWDTAVHGRGELASVQSPYGVETQFGYDANGHLSGKRWKIITASVKADAAFAFLYDQDGRLEQITYPDNKFGVRYQYGAFGDLTRVIDAATNQSFWQWLDADASGGFIRAQLGNGIVRDDVADQRYPTLPHSVRSALGGKALQYLTYDFVDNGALKQRTDHVAGTVDRFEFDALDRLSRWTQGSSKDIHYDYNDAGSLTQEDPIPPATGSTVVFSSSGAHHAVTHRDAGTYHYDALGQRISSPQESSIHWTDLGLPSDITNATETTRFIYDGEGHRVASVGDRELTLLFDGLFERRMHRSASEDRYAVVVNANPISEVTRDSNGTGRSLYLHPDGFGNVSMVTDAAGAVVDRFTYEPFGARALVTAAGQTPSGVRRGFGGHYHDDALGLINMGGRLYDPRARSFLSPDPQIADLYSAVSLNPYSYAFYSPFLWRDASGLSIDSNFHSTPSAAPEQSRAESAPPNLATPDATPDQVGGECVDLSKNRCDPEPLPVPRSTGISNAERPSDGPPPQSRANDDGTGERQVQYTPPLIYHGNADLPISSPWYDPIQIAVMTFTGGGSALARPAAGRGIGRLLARLLGRSAPVAVRAVERSLAEQAEAFVFKQSIGGLMFVEARAWLARAAGSAAEKTVAMSILLRRINALTSGSWRVATEILAADGSRIWVGAEQPAIVVISPAGQVFKGTMEAVKISAQGAWTVLYDLLKLVD